MSKMKEKDYSLLRPFTAETPVGTKVMWKDNSNSGELLGFDCSGKPVFKGHKNNGAIVVVANVYADCLLCIAPLAWVEGKPVYKGDLLYHINEKTVIAYKVESVIDELIYFKGYDYPSEIKHMRWDPPMATREGWVNIYQAYHYVAATGGIVFATREEADRRASQNRISCVRIEWEEPSC